MTPLEMLRHNLPPQPTPFVGRTDELAHLAQLLADPACRLLTLVGPGGIGKTRLALRAVEDAAELFDDGVYFVPCAPVGSPDLVVSAIADALKFSFRGEQDLKSQLIHYLHPKNVLLVIDNFDHLVQAAGLLADTLDLCPAVKMVVTSRERLNLQHEWVFEVSGLDCPRTEAIESLEDYSAVQLFLQTARRIHLGFAMQDAQKPAIVRICQLVDGMPLGIELASAWIRALSCEEIAAEIERSLDILETPARNVPERHRNMRAVLEHSWTRLPDAERQIFRKLAVFRGGFSREGAELVAGAPLSTLSTLVDKSLLRFTPAGRYEMHELLRQYAEEQLNAWPEEREAVHELHCVYYAEFMHQSWVHLKTHRQIVTLDAIESEFDNVRAAWHYMVERGKAVEIAKSASSLWYYCDLRCRYQEGLELLSLATEMLRSSPARKERDVALGQGLALECWFLATSIGMIGEREGEQPPIAEALALLQTVDSPDETVTALVGLCHPCIDCAEVDLPTATQIAQEGFRLARQHGNQWGMAFTLYWLGLAALRVHDHEEAQRLGEDSLKIAEEIGDTWLTACNCALLLGATALDRGYYEDARRWYRRSLRLYEQGGQLYGVTAAHLGLCVVALGLNDADEARRQFQEGMKLYAQISKSVAVFLCDVASRLPALGKKEATVELLALVLQHTVVFRMIRDWAKAFLAKLEGELPPEVFAAAWERGSTLDPETAIEALLERI